MSNYEAILVGRGIAALLSTMNLMGEDVPIIAATNLPPPKKLLTLRDMDPPEFGINRKERRAQERGTKKRGR